MYKKSFSSLFHKFVTATAILAMITAALPAMPVAAASSITVNITSDEYLNNTDCSLREAIVAANNNESGYGCTRVGTGTDDVITLASGVTYPLTRVGTTTTTGDLDIANPTSGNLTIQASGTTNAIIDASAIGNRVMEVDRLQDTDLTLIHITLTGGNSPDGAGLYFGGNGDLTISDSTISDNTATGEANCGAGVFNSSLSNVTIDNTTIKNNTCTAPGADGAGLVKATGGTLTVTNSTFANNVTPNNGGGVRIDIDGGTATITNSTFVNNTAGARGGGLQVKSGTVTVSFSTFSGNSANYSGGASIGGAVQATGGSVNVLQSILANSLTNSLPGQDCDELDPGVVTVTNSLVELNSDCGGTVVSNADPMLDTLGDNGGPTPTMALLPDSPAIDLSDDTGCPPADQRGVDRPQGYHCDLGAYEAEYWARIQSITRVNASPTNVASVQFLVTFNESVTGGDASNFSLTTTGSVSGASITDVSAGPGATRTVTVNTGSGDGTIRLDMANSTGITNALGYAVGNLPYITGGVYTIDRTGPLVNIGAPSVAVVSTGSVDFPVTITGSTTRNLTVADLGLNTTGTATGTISVTNGTTANPTVTINAVSGDGTIGISIAAGIASDSIGNTSAAAGPSTTFTVDNTGPSVNTIVRADPDPTSAASVDFTVTFSENVTGVDVSDFVLATSNVSGASITGVTGTGATYSVTVSTGFGAGTIRLDVDDDNTIVDALNNMLGGTGPDDGNFTSGEAYTINRPNMDVKIGKQPSVGYFVAPATEKRLSYTGVNNGPVQAESMNSSSLMPSIRVIFNIKSYSEMMGLPFEQVSQEYWFPSYNNVTLNSQLRVGNLGNTSTVIKVYLGNIQIDSYTLSAGGATRKVYAYNGGPLRVTSSATKILSTIRLLYNNQSFSELMGLPKEQLTTSYLFPYYNNVAMTSNLQVSNVGTTSTTIKVYLGTTQIDSYTLAAKSTLSGNYAGQNSGPLKVTSSAAKIVPSLRVLYAGQSYSEMIGYPANKLTTEFWYPTYDNATLNSQLRVSNVGTASTIITVYFGGQQIDSYPLAAGTASRKNYKDINKVPLNGGPLHVVSSSQPILSTVRELYTTPGFQSFYELMGLPKTQLSTQYYFPWYNNVAMNSELRFAAP